MSDDLPTFSAMQDAPDLERERALIFQSDYPAELVDPADVLGDERWDGMSRSAALRGSDAFDDFAFAWGWEMNRQQRAEALASVALDRAMTSIIGPASDSVLVPPDPEEVAARTKAARLARTRGWQRG